MINELNENIKEQMVEEISSRLLKLPSERIDEFFYRCSIIHITDPGFKALNKRMLSEIKRNGKNSTVFADLLMKRPIAEVIKNLEYEESVVGKN